MKIDLTVAKIDLPNDVALVSSTYLGGGQIATRYVLVGRRADAVVVLVTDDRGVVTDDVSVDGVADTHPLIVGCYAQDRTETVIAAVPRTGCASGQESVSAAVGWNLLGDKLDTLSPPMECPCRLVTSAK
jgi:hypothetical protein